MKVDSGEPTSTVTDLTATGFTFTGYIRGLEPGEAPDPDTFELLWARLRGVLVLELKRRSLWWMKPRCLGIFGPASWQDPEALDELVADCYKFVFLSRLGGLRAHLTAKDNVDGLVFRSIHNYLYDLQKKHDPLGFRVFTTLQTAIRCCCDDGRLHILAGDERIRNDTVLGFDARADPKQTAEHDPVSLDPRVAAWNNDLLPEMVNARGKKRDRLVRRLAQHVDSLRDLELKAFTFAQLLEPLKEDARRRWNAIWAYSEDSWPANQGDELGGLVRQVEPDTRLEQRQAFESLTHCVSSRIEELSEAPKTHDRLRRLWTLVRHQVTEGDPTRPASRRRVSNLLDIPRDSLQSLYSTLGRLLRDCQSVELP